MKLHCVARRLFLVFVAAGCGLAVVAADVDTDAFCSVRPLGLYCNPEIESEKIECPSGKRFTCPKAPEEICQERGILRQYGFRGGIARCVPKLEEELVTQFCSERDVGVYCFDEPEQNIRLHCPSGIVWKCRDDAEAEGPACSQTSSRYATCEEGGSNAGSVVLSQTDLLSTTPSASTVFCPTIETFTVTVTRYVPPTSSTNTNVGGGIGVGSIESPTLTDTLIPQVTSIAAEPCQNGTVLTLLEPPPGSRFTYRLTDNRIPERSVASACRELGGRMAFISDVIEHYHLGLQLCHPAWYRRWEGNDYESFARDPVSTSVFQPKQEACLALYPGGASGVPPEKCEQLLQGLCKFE